MVAKFDWSAIKSDYIQQCLKKENTPTAYFTNKYGVKYHTFMRKKGEANWDKEVVKQRKLLTKLTLKKVRTKLSDLDSDDILDEMKVRKKNMKLANVLLDDLVEEWIIKIQDPKERKSLTLSAIMNGIEMVSRLRGKAAGLAEKLEVNSKNINLNMDVDDKYLSPAENRLQLRKSEALADNLQKLLTEFEAIDVEPRSSTTKQSKASKVPKGKGSK